MTDPVHNLKMHFFNTSIGDIYRAIQGRCYLGAFTLSMCAIDALVYLHYEGIKRQGRETFKEWTQRYMSSIQGGDQRSRVLYYLRCGLVHAHGYSSQGENDQQDQLKSYHYTHDNPQRHWETDGQGGWVLNLDSFVTEVTRGAYQFFLDVEQGPPNDPDIRDRVLKNAKRIIYIRTPVSVQEPPKRFIDIPNLDEPARKALALFDDGLPDEVPLRDAIRAIYRKASAPSSSSNISPSNTSLFNTINRSSGGDAS